jgi:imidazolonepropionase-like amidohydrolase
MTFFIQRIASALVIAALASCASVPIPADLVIENATLYDGVNPKPRKRTVAVRDGVIIAVEKNGKTDFEGATIVDASGQYLTPGLWDAHAHIRSSEAGGLDTAEFPKYGVTSIHDLGGYMDRIKETEASIENGDATGPHIYPVYYMLNGESFAGYQHVVTSAGDIAMAVNELAAAGAYQIKTHRALAPEMLPVLLQTSHTLGIKVTGHIPLGVDPLEACEMGMDGIEHIGSFLEAWISVAPEEQKNAAAAADHMLSEDAQPLYDCLAKKKVVVTPTVIVYREVAKKRADGGDIPAEHREFIEKMKQIAYRLYTSGVTMLTGTDTTDIPDMFSLTPGEALHEELSMLEDAGIPPVDILSMATFNAAKAIGVANRTGSIEVGNTADILILTADPGEAVENLRAISAVYKGGVKVAGN